ncbi:hypothetical protein POX08_18235, partial [Enterobacter roggenkampii]
MKAGVFLNLLLLTLSFDVAAFTQFKPAVLNAALLFDHDATTGNVKHSLQWMRDVTGKLQVMTEVREGANKQVISSQADSLIKISRIWAD